MDIYDRATEQEEKERERAIRIARAAPARDYEAEICNGCSYATQTNYGKRCDAWVECLADFTKRERAAR